MGRCTSPFYRLDIEACKQDKSLELLLRGSPAVKFSVNGGFFGSWSQLPELHLNLERLKPYISKIRCGHCRACLESRRKTWATRIYLESKLYDHNYFCTLTYSDSHLPYSDSFVNPINGEVGCSYLVKSQVSSFMKNFRKRLSDHFGHTGIRFYACGEYGDLFDRPHYHLALFNMPAQFDQELDYFFTNPFGNTVYKCPLADDVWKRGFTSFEQLNSFNSSYVARYVLKKLNGKALSDVPLHMPGFEARPQPFSLMSNRPGIASGYFEKFKDDIYLSDCLSFSKDYELYKTIPPRYFDKLYDSYAPEHFAEIKKLRKQSFSLDEDFSSFSESPMSRLAREEEILKRKEKKQKSYL